MNKILGLSLGFLLSLGLVGCGTKKLAQPKTTAVSRTEQKPTALYSSLAERSASWVAVKASLQAEIEAKGHSLDAKINLQAARGKGIRMSVVKLLFEVARAWFTPEGVTLVDLYNGRYVQVDYATFSKHLGVNIDYGQVEALFMGQVFNPGKGADIESISKLTYSPLRGGEHRLSGKIMGSQYNFTLSPTSILKLITVLGQRNQKVFEAEYSSTALDRLPVLEPSATASYSIYKDANEPKGRLSLQWKRVELLDNTDELQLEPVIKSKYEQVSLESVLKLLEGF